MLTYAGSALRLMKNFHWEFGELELGPFVILFLRGISSGPQKQYLSSDTHSFPSLWMKLQPDWTWARWKAHKQNMRCNSLVFIFESIHLLSHTCKKIHFYLFTLVSKRLKGTQLEWSTALENWNKISKCLSCSKLSHFLHP